MNREHQPKLQLYGQTLNKISFNRNKVFFLPNCGNWNNKAEGKWGPTISCPMGLEHIVIPLGCKKYVLTSSLDLTLLKYAIWNGQAIMQDWDKAVIENLDNLQPSMIENLYDRTVRSKFSMNYYQRHPTYVPPTYTEEQKKHQLLIMSMVNFATLEIMVTKIPRKKQCKS